MIIVRIIDKQNKEYAHSCRTQDQAELLVAMAIEEGCEAKIMGNKK